MEERLVSGDGREDDAAVELAIRPKTVEGHYQRLMAKLDIHTRAGLVTYGRRVSVQKKLF